MIAEYLTSNELLGRLLQIEIPNATTANQDVDVEETAKTAAIIGGSVLTALIVLSAIYAILSIYLFCSLAMKDSSLHPSQRVFGLGCMLGYWLVVCFTPCCFMIIYYCITLGMINERRHVVVGNYNSPPMVQVINVAQSQPAPQAVPEAIAVNAAPTKGQAVV